jgi:metal-responsive CopG/Arc/MetJ family transcriptional regulator
MKTVQMTFEEGLLRSVDDAVRKLHTTRSAFTRTALREALKLMKTREMEEKHRQGYRRYPAVKNEFAVWEKEQAWGEE